MSIKKAAVFVLALGIASVAYAVRYSNEVLVSHTFPTQIPRQSARTGWNLDNNGPNAEDCAIGQNPGDAGPPVYDDGGLVLGAAGVVGTGHAHQIKAGGSWSGTEPVGVQIWCLAYTADQSAGAATVITESP